MRAAAIVMLLGACSAPIPEGRLLCTTAATDCPSGWFCVGGTCVSQPTDAATPDLGDLDAGAIDGSAADAGRPDELVRVVAGDTHACVLTLAGRIWCWGYNMQGEVGNDSTTMTTTAVPVAAPPASTLPAFTDLCAGGQHTCAIARDGSVWCWGRNDTGQIGTGSFATLYQRPTQIMSSGVTALACGAAHTCAATGSAVSCWGYNLAGEIGDGTRTNRNAPTPVMGLPAATVTNLAAGSGHSCAAFAGGDVWCWGWNSHGQLGDPTLGTGVLASSTAPVRVTGLPSALRVFAGAEFTCATSTAHVLTCWGENTHAQLGTAGADRTMPGASVVLSGDVLAAAGGPQHACAVGDTLAPTCWGHNQSGQVGNGMTMPVADTAPTATAAVWSHARDVAAGTDFSCAIESGRALCWGLNAHGQLGNATTTDATSPTPVVGIDLGP